MESNLFPETQLPLGFNTSQKPRFKWKRCSIAEANHGKSYPDRLGELQN